MQFRWFTCLHLLDANVHIANLETSDSFTSGILLPCHAVQEVAVAEQLPLPSQQHPPGVPGHQPAEGSAQASMPSHSNAQGGPNHAAPQATCSSVPGSAYPTRAATPLACTGSIAAPELLSAQAVPTQPPGELTGPPTSLPGQEQQQQQQVQAILLPAQGQFPSQPGAFVDGEEQGASASALQAAQQQQQDQLHQQELSLQQQQDALLRDYGQQLCGGEAGQQPQQMQSQVSRAYRCARDASGPLTTGNFTLAHVRLDLRYGS